MQELQQICVLEPLEQCSLGCFGVKSPTGQVAALPYAEARPVRDDHLLAMGQLAYIHNIIIKRIVTQSA